MEALLLLKQCWRAPKNNLIGPNLQILHDNNHSQGAIMNWDQVAGKWKQFKGKIRESWGRFTKDDNEQLKGRREQLDGFLQESFGTIKGIAEKK